MSKDYPQYNFSWLWDNGDINFKRQKIKSFLLWIGTFHNRYRVSENEKIMFDKIWKWEQ